MAGSTGDYYGYSGAETGDMNELSFAGVGTSGGTVAASSVWKYTGSYSYRMNPTTTAIGYIRLSDQGGGNIGSADLRAGGRFNPATLPAANDEEIMVFEDNVSAARLGIRITSGGVLKAYNSTPTALQTGTTVVQAGDYIEGRLQGNTGTAAWEVRINGVTELSSSVGGTISMTATNVQRVAFGKRNDRNGNSVDFYWDDCALREAAWLYANSAAPRIYIHMPTASGTYSTWTNGAGTAPTNVAEIPHDSGTSYIAGPAAATAHTFTVQSCTTVGMVGTPLCVRPFFACGYSAGTRESSLRLRSGGADFDTNTATVTAYNWRGAIQYLTDPADSTAWTISKVNALEVGPTQSGTSTGNRCTSTGIMTLADGITPAPAGTNWTSLATGHIGLSINRGAFR